MKTEIRNVIEDAIFDSADRAKNLQGEDRAREIKNIGLLVDKTCEDYKIEEDILDRRYKMDSDEQIAVKKLELERDKFEDEADARRKPKPDTVLKLLGAFGITAITIVYEGTGRIVPKIIPKPSDLINWKSDK